MLRKREKRAIIPLMGKALHVPFDTIKEINKEKFGNSRKESGNVNARRTGKCVDPKRDKNWLKIIRY